MRHGEARLRLLVLLALARRGAQACSRDGQCGHGTCQGYDSGPPVVQGTCACDSGWSGDACAQPTNCGPAPSPPHTTGCSGTKTFGQSCTATCTEAGWTKGDISATYTCAASGSYMGSGPTCEKVTCNAGQAAADASDCPAGTWDPTNPTVCNAHCLHGYTQDGTSGSLTCGTGGKYSGALVCTPVPCDPYGYPGYNGHPAEPTADDWDGYPLRWISKTEDRPKGEQPHHSCVAGHFGTKCTLVCDGGYDGSNASPFTCTLPGTAATPDGTKGRWTGGSLTCTGKLCTHRPAADVGYREISKANLVAQANVTRFPSTVQFDACPRATGSTMCRLNPNTDERDLCRGQYLDGDYVWECGPNGQYVQRPNQDPTKLPTGPSPPGRLTCRPCAEVANCENEQDYVTCPIVNAENPWVHYVTTQAIPPQHDNQGCFSEKLVVFSDQRCRRCWDLGAAVGVSALQRWLY